MRRGWPRVLELQHCLLLAYSTGGTVLIIQPITMRYWTKASSTILAVIHYNIIVADIFHKKYYLLAELYDWL